MQNSVIDVSLDNVYRKISAIDPLSKPDYRQYDGIAFARLFSDVFGAILRFNATAKSYMVYDGTRWTQDIENMMAEGYAKLFARALARYAYEHEDAPKDFVHAVQCYGDCNKRKTLVNDSRSYNFIMQTDLDNHPNLLNCKNGILDLDTLELKPHDPELLLSKRANFFFDPSAESKLFLRFMDEIMMGDKEKIRYIQTLLGYAMTGTATMEQFYLFYGSSTRNGKSTLLGIIQHLMGDYACSINPESLAQAKEYNGRSANGDIARLQGIRFLQCSEPPKRMKLNVELVKKLTGGDIITARHLYERDFDFLPVFTLFMNSNYLPVVLDNTLFTSGRVKVIEFNRHFEPHEQDTKLKQKLRSAENLSGIANWMIQGLRMYHDHGDRFIVPESVERATSDYKDKSDKLKAFFADRMTKNPQCTVTAKAVYEEYSKWCKDNGYGVENKSNFMDDLRNKNLLSPTGTIAGLTVRNVIKGYSIDHIA